MFWEGNSTYLVVWQNLKKNFDAIKKFQIKFEDFYKF